METNGEIMNDKRNCCYCLHFESWAEHTHYTDEPFNCGRCKINESDENVGEGYVCDKYEYSERADDLYNGKSWEFIFW